MIKIYCAISREGDFTHNYDANTFFTVHCYAIEKLTKKKEILNRNSMLQVHVEMGK